MISARNGFLASSLVLVFAASSALAYDVNKDIKNTGPTAYDIAVVLAGAETVTSTFNG
ncbi:hypothetical protein JGU66_03905 [Myxococcaceae bacterium JPH2]|nr:hypothetical protein [Myxococcaceae bacterium JPH2]